MSRRTSTSLRSGWLGQRLAVLLLAAALAPSSCESDEQGPTCASECPCTETGCPAGICGVRVELNADCATVAPRAELVFGDCLEEADLQPGVPAVACGFVVETQSSSLVIRADAFQWGPFDLECPEGGGVLLPVTVSCTSR